MSDEVEQLRFGLLAVAERARVEADAGAPPVMVARYVDLEVRHVLAGHDAGHSRNCVECLCIPAGR